MAIREKPAALDFEEGRGMAWDREGWRGSWGGCSRDAKGNGEGRGKEGRGEARREGIRGETQDRFCSLIPPQRSHNPHVSSNTFFGNKINDTQILVVYCLTFQSILTFPSWKKCLVVSKGRLHQVQ